MPGASAALAMPQPQVRVVQPPVGTGEDRLSNLVGMSITGANSVATINAMVWQVWNESLVIGSTGTSTGIVNVVTDDTSITSNQIWTSWNISFSTNGSAINVIPAYQQRVQPVAGDANYQRRAIEAEAERARARERAARLLHEHLTAEQLEELSREGRFHLDVLSQDGRRRRYRINRGRSRNVQEVDPGNGRIIKTLCAHPVAYVPDEDTMLAQKLMLETAEAEFLRIANHS